MSCDIQKACVIDPHKCAMCWDTEKCDKCDMPKRCDEFWDFNITPKLPEPIIMLRVGLLPPTSPGSRGVRCHDASFIKGVELSIMQLESVPPSDPLLERYTQKQACASSSEPYNPMHLEAMPWWSSSVQTMTEPLAAPDLYLYWRARVGIVEEEGNMTEHHCLLQAASSPCQRTTRQVLSVLDRSAAISLYAAKFNSQIAANFHGEFESQMFDNEEQKLQVGPSVQIAIPVGCMVISSSAPEVLDLGDSVILFPYAPMEIQKFVFAEPSDNALELPQAFFHFMAHISEGRQLVWDLQGSEYEDGSVLLVDPWLLQHPHATQESLGLLHKLHPMCNPLCLMFSERRSSQDEVCRSAGIPHCNSALHAGSRCMSEGLLAWMRCAESWALQ